MESTIKIPLSRDMVAIIDASDFDKVKDFMWSVSERNRPYARRLSRERKKIYMHRVITGAKTGQMVDHINGDVLDNRRRNLRLVNNSQNNWNRRKSKNTSTDFLGVSKDNKSYRSCIHHQGKKVNLGTFDNPYEAAVRYDMEKAMLAGEYGSYNFNELCGQRKLKNLITYSTENITVIFRKKTNGKVRLLYCCIDDNFYTSRAHQVAVEEKNLILAKDIDVNEFRLISTDSIIAVKINDRFYAKQLKL